MDYECQHRVCRYVVDRLRGTTTWSRVRRTRTSGRRTRTRAARDSRPAAVPPRTPPRPSWRRPHSAVRNVRCCPPSAPHSAAAVCPRAGTIDDSENRESIQNLNFQVNREPTIRQNGRNLLLKELIHESRIELKSLFLNESWIDDSQILLNHTGPSLSVAERKKEERGDCSTA